MATYLPTETVLNVAVSCFANYKSPENPVTINLLTWLRSSKHWAKIEALRLVADKTKRDAIKSTLPAITPSGVFTYREEPFMVAGSHTRLLQFDIDLKENPHIRNYADLKAQIRNLPFVAYCALSASGKGYWGLVPIAYPERHKQHFDALKRVFAYYGIYLDTKPRNVASLRGYSYDAAPYWPRQVMVFELYDEPKPINPRPFNRTIDADTEQQRVEVCIEELLRRRSCIGDNYGDWYEVGCSLANTFGENGREYFHQISQNYDNGTYRYDFHKADKQYTACLKAESKATIGTFFYFCQQQGIEWKELMPTTIIRHNSTSKDPHDWAAYFKRLSAYVPSQPAGSVDMSEASPSFWNRTAGERATIALKPHQHLPGGAIIYRLISVITINKSYYEPIRASYPGAFPGQIQPRNVERPNP